MTNDGGRAGRFSVPSTRRIDFPGGQRWGLVGLLGYFKFDRCDGLAEKAKGGLMMRFIFGGGF